jgi:uncharacterized membrane protein YfhO
MLELFLNASHVLTINTAYERSNTINDYADFYNGNQPVFDAIKNRDNGFYRVEKNYFRTANDPMLFSYNGITHYSSTLNRSVMSFLPRVGFRYYPYRFLYREGSDAAADALLGIKYLVSGPHISKPYTSLFSMNGYTVYENPYALPLMFTADPETLNKEISDGKGGFELQNQIFSALTGEEMKIFIPAESEDPVIHDLVSFSDGGDMCFSVNSEDSVGNLGWDIHIDHPDTLYAFFPAENVYPVTLTMNDKPSGYYFDNFSYHILRLGSFENGQTVNLKMTTIEDQVCLSDAQFYYEDLSVLEKASATLRQDETELHKLSSSHLTGTFTSSSDKILFFTIPFSNGWTIKIDGQKVPVFKAMDIFMAVSAPSGTHSVKMRYIPSGFMTGIIISVLSAAAAVYSEKRKLLSDVND